MLRQTANKLGMEDSSKLDMSNISFKPKKVVKFQPTVKKEKKKSNKDLLATEITSNFSAIINKLNTQKYYLLFSCFLTVYAIFATNVKFVFLSKEHDTWIDVTILICICIFVGELISFSLLFNDYRLSFYFYIDILSILSLTLEMQFVQELLTNSFTKYFLN